MRSFSFHCPRYGRRYMSKRALPGFASGILLIALLAQVLRPATAAERPTTDRSAPQSPAELFDTTAVWTVHLSLTPEQWAAMEPKGGRSAFGLMFGGPGGRPN